MVKVGDYIDTPRFCAVLIEKVFDSEAVARQDGYHEPTHFDGPLYRIYGKHTGINRMVFAAVKK